VPRNGAVERQLDRRPPPSVTSGKVVVERGPTDAAGNLGPPAGGEIVLSVPSPDALVSQADEARRVITGAGTGVESLVVVIEAAEELREEELATVLEAAGRTSRAVILRVMRNA